MHVIFCKGHFTLRKVGMNGSLDVEIIQHKSLAFPLTDQNYCSFHQLRYLSLKPLSGKSAKYHSLNVRNRSIRGHFKHSLIE